MEAEQIEPLITPQTEVTTAGVQEEPVADVKETETRETDGSSQADASDSDESTGENPLMGLFGLLSSAKAQIEAARARRATFGPAVATEDAKTESEGVRVTGDVPIQTNVSDTVIPGSGIPYIPCEISPMPDQGQAFMTGLMSSLGPQLASLAPMLGSMAPQLMSATSNPETLASLFTQMAAGLSPAMISQMRSTQPCRVIPESSTGGYCQCPSNCPSRCDSSSSNSTSRQTEMAFEVVKQFASIFDQWLNKPKESTAHCVIEHRIRFVKE